MKSHGVIGFAIGLFVSASVGIIVTALMLAKSFDEWIECNWDDNTEKE